jgi:hypothetical protein
VTRIDVTLLVTGDLAQAAASAHCRFLLSGQIATFQLLDYPSFYQKLYLKDPFFVRIIDPEFTLTRKWCFRDQGKTEVNREKGNHSELGGECLVLYNL